MEEKMCCCKKMPVSPRLPSTDRDAMNSMNKGLVDDFIAALMDVKQDPETRVVVLTGAGKAFCAGGDLFYLASLTEPIVAHRFIGQAGTIISLIRGMEKPVHR